jgi:hypothetical protein
VFKNLLTNLAGKASGLFGLLLGGGSKIPLIALAVLAVALGAQTLRLNLEQARHEITQIRLDEERGRVLALLDSQLQDQGNILALQAQLREAYALRERERREARERAEILAGAQDVPVTTEQDESGSSASGGKLKVMDHESSVKVIAHLNRAFAF